MYNSFLGKAFRLTDSITISGGHMKFVDVLSNFMPNPNAPGNDGWTPLALAAMNGYVDIVKFMAGFTKTPNAKGLIDWTPIQLAARFGHLEIVKLLVELTDDPNFSDSFVTTPIEAGRFDCWGCVHLDLF